ncbi:hypothetical protein PINS_up007433 [Pythium insidiosum]|nr:hypothetical protein PINS_up007433 [Pythium insidiosum]
MDALVQSAAASVSKGGRRVDHAPLAEEQDEDDEDDDENPSRWLVGDGEHRVLKTLTNESLAWFLETVATTAMAALPARDAVSSCGGGPIPRRGRGAGAAGQVPRHLHGS